MKVLNARLDDAGWFRCAKCGHKLGKMRGAWSVVQAMPALEIKCHSCKQLNNILMGGYKGEAVSRL